MPQNRFYKTKDFTGFDALKVDDGMTYVAVRTPKGWKCKRKGCKIDFKHFHNTYSQMLNCPTK